MTYSKRGAFALFSLALLLFELWTPAVYAQSAAVPSSSSIPNPAPLTAPAQPSIPSQVGACTISQFTQQQALDFMRSTTNFNGKELTDRNDISLTKNGSTSPGNVVNVYNFPVDASTSFMSVKDLASVMGRNPADVASELNLDDEKDADGKVTKKAVDKQITVAQATALAATDPKSGTLIDRIKSMGKKDTTPSAPGFEDLKVTLPNGKAVALSEMFKMQQLANTPGQKNACLIDSTDIRGKFTYNALLDHDVLMGSTTGFNFSSDQASYDHLNTKTIQGAFNNYDGNIVIGRTYEMAVKAMGSYMFWDIMLSGMLTLGSFRENMVAKKYLDNTNELLKSSEQGYVAAAQRQVEASNLGSQLKNLRNTKMRAKLMGNSAEAKLTSTDFDSYAKSAVTDYFNGLDDAARAEKATALGIKSSDPDALTEAVKKKALSENDIDTALGGIYQNIPLIDTNAIKSMQANAKGLKEAVSGLGGTPNYPQVAESISENGALNAYNMKFFPEGGGPKDVAALATDLSNRDQAEMINFLNDQASRLDDAAAKASVRGVSAQEISDVKILSDHDAAVAAKTELETNKIRLSQFAFDTGLKRVYTNVVLGITWMGPARLGLELAGAVSFASSGVDTQDHGSFVRLFANTKPAEAFRKGTDILFIGSLITLLGNIMQITAPSKVFQVDSLIATQIPSDTGMEVNWLTSINQQDQSWVINTNWQGKSSLTAFEDVRDAKSITSVAVQTNYLKLGGVLKRQAEGEKYYNSLIYIAPLVGWRLLSVKSPTIAPLSTFLQIEVLQYYVENLIDPNAFTKADTCTDDQLDAYVRGYRNAVIATSTEQLVLYSPFTEALAPVNLVKTFSTFLKGTKLKTAAQVATKVETSFTAVTSNAVDPLELYKQYAMSNVFNYASNCKDPSYKIIAYQNIPEKSAKSSVIKNIQGKVSNPFNIPDLGKLNVGQLFTGAGSNLDPRTLKEILNVKVNMENQNGRINPADLYYIHLDPQGASLSWWAPYENQCFRQCQVSSDGSYICADNTGVYKVDKDGNHVYYADADHALLSQFVLGLGQVIPNKLITAPLSCGAVPVLSATGDGKLTVSSSSCPATACAMQSLSLISGQTVGNDISKALGVTQVIHTTQGTGYVINGQIHFVRSAGVTVTERNTYLPIVHLPVGGTHDVGIAGTQTQANASGYLQQQQSLIGKEYVFSTLEILGDGTVRAKPGTVQSNTATDVKSGLQASETEFGDLLTIRSENGVIQYDRVARRLVIGLQLLSEAVPAKDITGMYASPTTVSGGKTDLAALEQQLIALNAKLASGQQLNAQELELLRNALLKSQASGQTGLSATEKQQLQAALDKQNSGKSLSQAEADLIRKSQQAQPYPGVVVVTPANIDRINQAANSVGATDVAAVTGKLAQKTPISSAEQATVAAALDKAVAQNKISTTDAQQLKNAVMGSVATSDKANQVVSAVSNGQPLTKEQLDAALAAIASERQAAANRAASATTASLPAIKLGGITSKIGAEQGAAGLNAALDKIGGMTQFSTDTKKISIEDNGKGQAVINVVDKTGATPNQQLLVNGVPTRDANGGISIPTDKGPVNIQMSVNPSSGQPIINVAGPNIKENGPMILAQGPNGYLWFDPQTGTWKTGNGLVVPSDSAFGTNGISFYQGNQGTTGIADPNRFGNANSNVNGAQGSNPLLALPGVPNPSQQPLGAVIMLLALLAGVGFIRYKGKK